MELYVILYHFETKDGNTKTKIMYGPDNYENASGQYKKWQNFKGYSMYHLVKHNE